MRIFLRDYWTVYQIFVRNTQSALLKIFYSLYVQKEPVETDETSIRDESLLTTDAARPTELIRSSGEA